MARRELTALFNRKFGEDRTVIAITGALNRNNIQSGRTGRFEEGSSPWNADTKGLTSANITSFKKGNIPANIKPLGSERISADGYREIKIAEKNPYTGSPTRYKLKHVHIWEKANGPVPKGHILIFKDGNQLNCDIGNLALLSRAELLALNQHNYRRAHDELKPSIMALAKLQTKAKIRIRREKKVEEKPNDRKSR